MEIQKTVFDMIDGMSYPFLLLEENKESGYDKIYKNDVLTRLVNIVAEDEETPAVDEPSENRAEDEKIEEEQEKKLSPSDELDLLIQRYIDKSKPERYTFHDVEIFSSIYNINFIQTHGRVVVIFIEIYIEELFENITFHDVSETSSAIVVVLGENGQLVDVNERFLNLVEAKREKVIGKSFLHTFIPTKIDVLEKYFKEILDTDSYQKHFVTPLYSLKAKVHKVNWQLSKVVKRKHSYIVAVGEDISKFIEENGELKQKLRSIQVGFNYFPFAVGYMNSNGVFIEMNTRFKKMFRIDESHKKILFDNIPVFKKYIGFDKMKEHIHLLKEMSYKIDHSVHDKSVKLKVDVRMLIGKKESSTLYIVVAQIIE